MKRTATTLLLSLLAAILVLPALAQPVRNGLDVIWARDVDGAAMTLDGMLNEAAWQEAEMIVLQWDGDHPIPGSGQRTETAPVLTDPSDPNDGVIYVLRDGNTIWLGAQVQDKSVGGARGLWGMDGLIMNLLDRARFIEARVDMDGNKPNNFFQGNRTEFFYSWWNGTDTTDAASTFDDGSMVGSGLPMPGLSPRFHGFYGHNSTVGRPQENIDVWDGVTIVDGIANDDTHGEDVGYTMEMMIDATALGYDFTQPDGDKMAWNVALNDQDYNWPSNPDLSYLSRVWWQNQWGNNFNEGAGYLYGAPGVTISSGSLPDATEPEFTIPSGELFDAPTIDGALDDPTWSRFDPQFYIQYQADQELLDMNPEIARYYAFFFRPSIGGQNTALILDPSIGRVQMFFKDDKLYIGLDADDQAINGIEGEAGRDGIRLFFRDRDSLNTQGSLYTKRFGFAVDSTGSVIYEYDAIEYAGDPTALQAAVSLKGASTVANPDDVDEGYQIEIEIDLVKVLNYPAGRGDGMLWTAMNFFDGDFLATEEDSYATRTWLVNERNPEGASIYGYLDPETIVGTATEDVAEVPDAIRLMGNYPNPFNPVTTLRYALPQAGTVRVAVFDVLGRRLAVLSPGVQAAGTHELTFDAAQFASGMYLYRVEILDQAGNHVQTSRVGRMVLLK